MSKMAILVTLALAFRVTDPVSAQEAFAAFEGAWEGTVAIVGSDQRGLVAGVARFADSFGVRILISGEVATVFVESGEWLRLGEPGQFRLDVGADTTIVYGAVSVGQGIETWVLHLTRQSRSPSLRLALSRNTGSAVSNDLRQFASTMGAIGELTRVEDPDRDW